MGARKTQQEIEKCFKAVAIGVEAFDAQYEKYEQSTNASQRDKLVENIKKECKKLQRLRDQIKTWAAGNDVKDKAPLLERRELIEKKMEAFKAIEKEMKTKAFSKEGLNAASKLDPREKDKDDMLQFLGDCVDELGRQIEALEAESDALQSQAKKSKKGDAAKAERAQELEQKTDRHKWHQGRLELLMRALQNDDVEPDQVKEAEEGIKDYVDNNSEVDFFEDEGLYDDFNLEDEEGRYGVHQDMDRTSSHDNQSIQDEAADGATEPSKGKSKAASEAPQQQTGRRPSQHIKSPLPALATLNTAPPVSTVPASASMKPAPPPAKPPGEILKYASAAAAAASSNDTGGIGIAPLPPPPGRGPAAPPALTQAQQNRPAMSPSAAAPSPANATPAQENRPIAPLPPMERAPAPATVKSPTPSTSSIGTPSPAVSAAQLAQASAREEVPPLPTQSTEPTASASIIPDGVDGQNHDRAAEQEPTSVDGQDSPLPLTNGVDHTGHDELESVYHLPASLQELVDCYDAVQSAALPASQPQHQHQLASSYASRPDTFDAEKPRHYRPQNPSLSTPSHYPQEPLPIFDDPRLYSKIDTDALFYSFYYRQGTYQQYLAAKSLKQQSWRFHKQYQTWFQRHEEPKSITEDYEQGTYRFFDYESTWMNRRKQDFKFAYKFLEDDL